VVDRTRTKLGVIAGRGLPAAPRALLGQTVLGRYVIEAELGAGATGTVYRGRHLKIGRAVAIKVLHEDYATDRTMLARFRREAEAAGRLHHPNLSGVLDLGETTDGLPLLVMDLVVGRSLRVVMDEAADAALEANAAATGDDLAGDTLRDLGAPGGLLDRGRVIHLVRQILLGLDHAHAAGLVHRDLKPDNILVERDDRGAEIPRIVDFGIAALRTDDAWGMPASGSLQRSRLTETGTLLGTPIYMAPEQAP
jgi:serine/threonine protein kinase